jgi:hypothetical protein
MLRKYNTQRIIKYLEKYQPTLKLFQNIHELIENTSNEQRKVKEIKLLKSKKEIIIDFFDKKYSYSAEFLRVLSPSVESESINHSNYKKVFYIL